MALDCNETCAALRVSHVAVTLRQCAVIQRGELPYDSVTIVLSASHKQSDRKCVCARAVLVVVTPASPAQTRPRTSCQVVSRLDYGQSCAAALKEVTQILSQLLAVSGTNEKAAATFYGHKSWDTPVNQFHHLSFTSSEVLPPNLAKRRKYKPRPSPFGIY